MFKWAASYELLPASCYEALRTVESIKRGRTKARETEPVRCAALAAIAAAQAHASTVVSAMISVQQLTGMRPGELCGLRPGLIDRSAPVWIFTPEHHKTEHLNKRRRIFIGPQAQEILRPYLLRGDDCCCFSPADAVREMYEARHESRVTPEGQGNGPGTNVKKRPGCKPGDRYTVTAYNRAISRACDRAGIEHWHAHQLRHTFATEIRKDGGLEASAILLGHSSAEMTDAVYAERDERKAREVIRRLG
jgi:integrase